VPKYRRDGIKIIAEFPPDAKVGGSLLVVNSCFLLFAFFGLFCFGVGRTCFCSLRLRVRVLRDIAEGWFSPLLVSAEQQ